MSDQNRNVFWIRIDDVPEVRHVERYDMDQAFVNRLRRNLNVGAEAKPRQDDRRDPEIGPCIRHNRLCPNSDRLKDGAPFRIIPGNFRESHHTESNAAFDCNVFKPAVRVGRTLFGLE